jgi:hypothetical protein
MEIAAALNVNKRQNYITSCRLYFGAIIQSMNDVQKPKRTYKRITPATVAKHKALAIAEGNGSAAVRILEPSRLSPKDRAFRITRKGEQMNAMDFIENTLQRIGVDAINRVGMMVNSIDEKVATRNAHYVIDHIRGQAVRRSESKHLEMTIEAVLTDD